MAFAQAPGAGKPNLLEQFFPFILIFLVFFFLVIRPSQKRQKTHQNFLTNLKRGDSVLTSGGILGTIEGITDQFVVLEISDGVKIRILKSQIGSSANEEKSNK
ncbi:MAG TPA: preprotein translocase subunit YajC [Bdellovibrionales bacterium]|nr:preprotein translocase subunit YajC [Pseudobdellovibrionaceae bacterium]HAG91984.1 preprotein translocase subunit YajC [Bdellovibrionales bacterium]